ncbi:MAG: N-acetyltransferase family protein [Bacillota bacterium]
MITVREVTEADLPGLARVLVDTWRATYRGIVPDSYLDAMSYEAHVQRGQQRLKEGGPGRSTWVAEVDGEIVGMASGGPERRHRADYPAELYAIYILPSHQGLGLGRRLVAGVAGRLRDAGFTSLLVWVLADNPSRRFYEALGGRLLEQGEIEIGGARLKEVAYVWQTWQELKIKGFGGAEKEDSQ